LAKENKMMKRLTSTIVIVISLINHSRAQISFPKIDLHNDIYSLYIMINEIHPNMFAFYSQIEIEEKLNKA